MPKVANRRHRRRFFPANVLIGAGLLILLLRLTYTSFGAQIPEHPNIHFITFSSSNSRFNYSRILRQAQDFPYHFASISGYSELNIPDDQFAQNGLPNVTEFVKRHSRGFGYWFWKPGLVLMKMKNMQDGDIILYADSGCTLNPNGIKRFTEYVNMVSSSKGGLLVFQLPHLEAVWTKGDTLLLLDCDAACQYSGQFVGTSWFIRKSQANIKFIETWLNYLLLNDAQYASDEPSKAPNNRMFHEHRHDQSIWSVLIKKRMRELGDVIALEDETWPRDGADFNSELAQPFPIWATRRG